MLGNDLFWTYTYMDEGFNLYQLFWSGYNDHSWWTKWSKNHEVQECADKKFRIDFTNCNVYEVTGDE